MDQTKDQKKPLNVRKWKNIVVLGIGMMLTSTITFNCAPSMFMANGGSASSSSSSSEALVVDDFAEVSKSPIVLMSVNETFNSMINVTGLVNAVPPAMRSEYALRAGALAETPAVTNVNAPLQLAATALAGEACNALIEKEIAGGTRKFFADVDFTKPLAQQPTAAFNNSIKALARAFWSRLPTTDETKLLRSFADDLPEGTAAIQTRGLYLGTCTAMLASFDALTF